jgi:hypothetical protein
MVAAAVAGVVVAPLLAVQVAAADVPPQVTLDPVSVVVNAGTTTLTSNAIGDPAPTPKWQISTDGGGTWANVATGTSASYRVAVDATTNGYQYRTVWTNAGGSATTLAATTSLATLPVVTTHPISGTYAPNSTVVLTAAASGAPAPTIRWQSSSNGTSWVNLNTTDSTSTTMSFRADALSSGKRYRAKFTNLAGITYSDPATITIPFAPQVTTQTSGGATVVVGQTVTLAASARGTELPAAQWERSADGGATWVDVPGATSTVATSLIGVTSTYSFPMEAGLDGSKYRARFSNALGVIRTNPVTVAVGFVPTITAQPQSVTVASGLGATFSVSYASDGPPTFQWQRSVDDGATFTNFNQVAGTQTPTLVLPPSSVDDKDVYRVRVSGSAGSVTSAAATLNVLSAPAVSTQPTNGSGVAGTAVTLVSQANGGPKPTAVGQRSVDGGSTWTPVWTDANLATAAYGRAPYKTTLSVTLAAGDPRVAWYRVVYSNSQGTATSAVATVTLLGPPVIATQPTDQFAATGSTATFRVVGSGHTAVRWQKRLGCASCFTDIPGATADSYSLTASPADNLQEYRAVLTNDDGSVTSTKAYLVVTDAPPRVLTEPADSLTDGGDYTTGCIFGFAYCTIGRTATFTASAGPSASSVQWQTSVDSGATWTDIAGATVLANGSSTYTRTNTVPTDHERQIRAVFTNAAGSTATRAAVMKVRYAPIATQQPASVTVPVGSSVTFTAAFRAYTDPDPSEWETAGPNSDVWTAVSGAPPGPTLVIDHVALSDTGRRYRARSHNMVDVFGYSAPATLTVVPASPPVAATPTTLPLVSDGTPVVMSFSATGSPAPDVVFQASADGWETWFEVPDASVTTVGDTTTVSVDIEAPIDANGWQARAVFTNAAGTVTSDPQILRVGRAPVAQQPVPLPIVADGTPVVMSFSATGSPAPDVVFQASADGWETWFEVPDASVTTVGDTTTVSVDIEAPIDANGWQARAVFTNELGTTISEPLTLRVVPAPSP